MANAHADIHHDDSHHGSDGQDVYFVPHGSRWPVFASVALFITMVGFASWLNEVSWGKTAFFVGLLIAVGMLLGADDVGVGARFALVGDPSPLRTAHEVLVCTVGDCYARRADCLVRHWETPPEGGATVAEHE